ncbi:MAG: hypothetical protein KGL46_14235 [Hyphomicrobiales bacterium]|nr:hypothetical protein [Hyphomicrobiales bacterium]
MIRALALICAVSTPADRCDADSARVVLSAPGRVQAMQCARAIEAMLAQSAIAPDRDTEYLKIVCKRENVR